MEPNPRPPEPDYGFGVVLEDARALDERCAALPPQSIIEASVRRYFPDRVAAVSSFGADSAVLLHMIAGIDRHLPVIFLDTGKHFAETIRYRDALLSDLGLTNIKSVAPDSDIVAADDPAGELNMTNPDACCAIRKVEPMERAVRPYDAWFTGRKRFQSATRARLPVFEAAGRKMRINPLAGWHSVDIQNYLYTNKLRRHPLVAHGYLSIGCMPCTAPVSPGQTARSGRWAGRNKTECGIHVGSAGVERRTGAGTGTMGDD